MSRLLLALYPPSFRERYEPELAALVEQIGCRPRVAVDLLLGALQVWLRPPMPVDPAERARRRVQATLATTWVAWCFGAVAMPTMNRALLDPPLPRVDATVRALLDAASVLLVAGGVLALGGALLLARHILLPALRRRERPLIRPLLPAVALLVLEAAGAGVLSLSRSGHPPDWAHPSVAFVVTALLWVLGFGALVLATGVGPALVLSRARPAVGVMRLPALLAAAVTAVLLALTGLHAAALTLGGFTGFGGAALVVSAPTSAAAVTSSVRGAVVLRRAAS